MRILEICNHFPPSIGGSETHNFSIVKYLHDQGHDVEVIVIRDLKGIKKLNHQDRTKEQLLSLEFFHQDLQGVHIHNIILKEHKFPYSHLCYFNIWKKVRQIEKERGRFDLIEIHFLPYALFLSNKRKIIMAIHSFAVACAKYPSPAQCYKPKVGICKCVNFKRYINWRLLNVICIHKINKVIVKYQYMARNVIKAGIPKNKIAVIPHWIDCEKFHGQMQKAITHGKDDSQRAFTFGFLGRLDDFKGIDMIIKAFKLLLDRGIKAKMLVIGDGILKKELEDFCWQNNISDYVRFIGEIEHDQIPIYLPLADVYIVGSPYDNYNWALLELMCSGKPIIATNTGGTCDILVDGYNAVLAEPNAESITEKMEYIIENYDSIEQIAENALQTVKEKHSLDNLKLYESLLMEIAKK